MVHTLVPLQTIAGWNYYSYSYAFFLGYFRHSKMIPHAEQNWRSLSTYSDDLRWRKTLNVSGRNTKHASGRHAEIQVWHWHASRRVFCISARLSVNCMHNDHASTKCVVWLPPRAPDTLSVFRPHTVITLSLLPDACFVSLRAWVSTACTMLTRLLNAWLDYHRVRHAGTSVSTTVFRYTCFSMSVVWTAAEYKR